MDSSTLRSPIRSLQPAKPISVSPDQSVKEVIEIMKKHGFGAVFVVENDALLGVFTERDVLTRVLGGEVELERTHVADVMTPNPEYLLPDDLVAFALNRMHMGGFRHIPLVDSKGLLFGVISVRDIVAYLCESISQAGGAASAGGS